MPQAKESTTRFGEEFGEPESASELPNEPNETKPGIAGEQVENSVEQRVEVATKQLEAAAKRMEAAADRAEVAANRMETAADEVEKTTGRLDKFFVDGRGGVHERRHDAIAADQGATN